MTHRSDGSAIEPRSRAIRKCVKSQVYPVSLVHDADITVETQRIRLLIPYVFLYTTFDSHDPRCRIRSAMWWQAANISSARARLPPLRSATLPCPPAPLPSPRPPPCLALSQSQLAPPQHHWCMLAAHRPQARPLVARAPSVVRAATRTPTTTTATAAARGCTTLATSARRRGRRGRCSRRRRSPRRRRGWRSHQRYGYFDSPGYESGVVVRRAGARQFRIFFLEIHRAEHSTHAPRTAVKHTIQQ